MPSVKDVGEPCAGEPHARFDGGREESGVNGRRPAGASRLPDRDLVEEPTDKVAMLSAIPGDDAPVYEGDDVGLETTDPMLDKEEEVDGDDVGELGTEGPGFPDPIDPDFIGVNAASTWISGHGVGSTQRFTADANGDERADSIVRFEGTGKWYVALSTGTSFAPYSEWINGFGSSATKLMMGDVNGDGKDDAVAFFEGNGHWLVALSTGSSFVNQGIWMSSFGMTSDDVLMGDVNGDGKDDVTAFFNGNGIWLVAHSTGSSFVNNGIGVENFGKSSTTRLLDD